MHLSTCIWRRSMQYTSVLSLDAHSAYVSGVECGVARMVAMHRVVMANGQSRAEQKQQSPSMLHWATLPLLSATTNTSLLATRADDRQEAAESTEPPSADPA